MNLILIIKHILFKAKNIGIYYIIYDVDIIEIIKNSYYN